MMLSKKVFSVEVVVWSVSAAGGMIVRIALLGIAAVEAELQMLRSHVAFPFVFRRETADTAVVGEGADEGPVGILGPGVPSRHILRLASSQVGLPLGGFKNPGVFGGWLEECGLRKCW